jgi:hypothetical protein
LGGSPGSARRDKNHASRGLTPEQAKGGSALPLIAFDRVRSNSFEEKNTRTRLGAMPACELNSVRIVDPAAADNDGNKAAA